MYVGRKKELFITCSLTVLYQYSVQCHTTSVYKNQAVKLWLPEESFIYNQNIFFAIN